MRRIINNSPTRDELRGEIYDVKSSGLRRGLGFPFFLNKGGVIDFYYLLAFNECWTELLYAWRVPEDFIEGRTLWIGLCNNYIYNIENMKEYEITDKFKDMDAFK